MASWSIIDAIDRRLTKDEINKIFPYPVAREEKEKSVSSSIHISLSKDDHDFIRTILLNISISSEDTLKREIPSADKDEHNLRLLNLEIKENIKNFSLDKNVYPTRKINPKRIGDIIARYDSSYGRYIKLDDVLRTISFTQDVNVKPSEKEIRLYPNILNTIEGKRSLTEEEINKLTDDEKVKADLRLIIFEDSFLSQTEFKSLKGLNVKYIDTIISKSLGIYDFPPRIATNTLRSVLKSVILLDSRDKPRHLTEYEKQIIVASIPRMNALDKTVRTISKQNIANWLHGQLNDVVLSPSMLLNYIQDLVMKFFRSRVSSGEAVGGVIAEVLVGVISQSWLKATHKAGEKQTSVSGGIKIRGLLKATKDKDPTTIIHFANPYMDFDETMNKRKELIELNINDLCPANNMILGIPESKDVDEMKEETILSRYWWHDVHHFLYNEEIPNSKDQYVLRLKLNRNIMYSYSLTVEDIVNVIKTKNIDNVVIVHNSITAMEGPMIDIYPKENNLVSVLSKEVKNLPLDVETSLLMRLFLNLCVKYVLNNTRILGIKELRNFRPIRIETHLAISKGKKTNNESEWIMSFYNRHLHYTGLTMDRIKYMYIYSGIKIIKDISEEPRVGNITDNMLIRMPNLSIPETLSYMKKPPSQYLSTFISGISNDELGEEKEVEGGWEINPKQGLLKNVRDRLLEMGFGIIDRDNKIIISYPYIDTFMKIPISSYLKRLDKTLNFNIIDEKFINGAWEFRSNDRNMYQILRQHEFSIEKKGDVTRYRVNYPKINRLQPKEYIELVVKNILSVRQSMISQKNNLATQPLERMFYYWHAECDGSNLQDLLSRSDINNKITISSRIHEILKYLGVQTAQNVFMKELYQTIADSGNYVSPRHILMITRLLFNKGIYMSVDPKGASKDSTELTEMMAHAGSTELIKNKAIIGGKTSLVGPISNDMTGSLIPVGTGSVHLVELDKVKLATAEINEYIEKIKEESEKLEQKRIEEKKQEELKSQSLEKKTLSLESKLITLGKQGGKLSISRPFKQDGSQKDAKSLKITRNKEEKKITNPEVKIDNVPFKETVVPSPVVFSENIINAVSSYNVSRINIPKEKEEYKSSFDMNEFIDLINRFNK